LAVSPINLCIVNVLNKSGHPQINAGLINDVYHLKYCYSYQVTFCKKS